MYTKASIIYRTKNGEHLLRRSLDSFFSQEAPFEYEVLAVDSGSTKGTVEVMKKCYSDPLMDCTSDKR